MKRILALGAALLLCCLCLITACADSLPMVADYAGLFTQEEITQMESLIGELRQTYGMDGVVLTERLSTMNDTALQDYADRTYEDSGYGLGSERNGFLILIDMGNRAVCVSTTGKLDYYMTYTRRDQLLDKAYGYLSNGQYGKAAVNLLKDMRTILRQGVREGTRLVDERTGLTVGEAWRELTPTEFMIAIGGGALVALILIMCVVRRYGLYSSTYRFNQSTQSAMNMDVNHERFIRETVRRIPRNTGSGPSGGHGGHPGGHGGHSAPVHHSSSGMRHGGGVRHF